MNYAEETWGSAALYTAVTVCALIAEITFEILFSVLYVFLRCLPFVLKWGTVCLCAAALPVAYYVATRHARDLYLITKRIRHRLMLV